MESRVPRCEDFRAGAVRQGRWIGWAFIAFFLSFFSAPASAASFDCKKAKTSFEKLVCSDIELSRLDEELAVTYKNALAASTDKNAQRNVQRAWLELARRKFTTITSLAHAYKRQIAYWRSFPFDYTHEKIARERAFAVRGATERLDCSSEATRILSRTRSYQDGEMWRNAIYLECLTGLLIAKQFDQVKREIAAMDGNPQIWGTRLLPRLGLIPNIMVHGVDNVEMALIFFECRSAAPYRGPELEDLVRVLLTRIAIDGDEPTMKGGGEFFFLGQFFRSISNNSCLERSYVVRLYNLLLDGGLDTAYWTEDYDGWIGKNGNVNSISNVMALGDEVLVSRILEGGVTTNPNIAMALFMHAPSLRMLRLVERFGFLITKEQASQIVRRFEVLRTLDTEEIEHTTFSGYLDSDLEIVAYIQSLTN